MKNIACSWSGGKDSCYALMLAKAMGYVPVVLLNMMNENGRISRSHGLSHEILNRQAHEAGLPLVTIPSSWEYYEKNFIDILIQMKSEYNLHGMVFGDIDIQVHRDWEEKVCKKADIEAILPLWKKERNELATEMIAAGIESMIVSCNSNLGEEFLGKFYNIELIRQLDHSEIDACGENGEFHSLVINCPLFKNRIHIPEYTKNTHRDYWFINWNM
jgi:diphthine-ammonia ligase